MRLAGKLFFRRVEVNDHRLLNIRGPLLIACNHPNSFLDAIVLDIMFEQPIASLARGDAFINKAVSTFMRAVNILPVYRTSEGTQNLQENYKTFDSCIELFRKKGLVLIFSEGLCINEWHLRPLKKGTARLAFQAWASGIPLAVLPTGLNYTSFRRTGKNVQINFGNLITADQIPYGLNEGQQYQVFNTLLTGSLKQLVHEIEPGDHPAINRLLTHPLPISKRIALYPLSILGWLSHALFYIPIKSWIKRLYGNTGHYDSVLFLALLLFYPFYLLLFFLIAAAFFGYLKALLVFLIVPFLAWCHIQVKEQVDA